MDYGIKTVTDSELSSTDRLWDHSFPQITNSTVLDSISMEDTAKTVYTSLEKEFLILTELKLTTSDLSERTAIVPKTTSKMVISSQDINSDTITKLGVSSRTVKSSDGDVSMKCKSDGVTSTTDTGLAILTSVNSMLLATQKFTRNSPLARKLKKAVQIHAVRNDLNESSINQSFNIYMYKELRI